MTFEWNNNKNLTNQKKHKVSFERATGVWKDPKRIVFYDESHSIDEERWIVIGFSGTVLFVVFTEKTKKPFGLFPQGRQIMKKAKDTIVTMTLDDVGKLPPMTVEERAEIESAPIRYDKDAPRLTKEQLAQFIPYYLAHSPFYKPRKTDVHLKIDVDVLEAFKAQGKGYQTRMNEVLRNYIFNKAN